jgi:hypothetical protein
MKVQGAAGREYTQYSAGALAVNVDEVAREMLARPARLPSDGLVLHFMIQTSARAWL